jgi:hypothetical protein
MIDLVDTAAQQLKEAGYADVHKKRLDTLTGCEGIVIRRLPYTVTEHYQDSSKTLSYLFQVIVRRRDEQLAMEQCSDIGELLDGAFIPSNNGSYIFTGCETYTEPQELELEENGFYAWEVRMEATIERIRP